jgi:hypothetical protein
MDGVLLRAVMSLDFAKTATSGRGFMVQSAAWRGLWDITS